MVVKVTMPSPPHCSSRTICPKTEKVWPMLTVDRPVTQMPEVDTKRASRKPMDWPGLVLTGSMRSSAPSSAPRRKPSMMIPVVVVFLFFISY